MRPCLPERRRQRDVGELRRERLGQVDDLDLALHELLGKLRQNAHVDNSLSSAFGLSRQRASHSCATSPGYTSSMPSCSALTTAPASAAGDTFGGRRS